jgi:hypothetical protein
MSKSDSGSLRAPAVWLHVAKAATVRLFARTKKSPCGLAAMISALLLSVGNNIILQYIAPFQAYYISTILRIAISY